MRGREWQEPEMTPGGAPDDVEMCPMTLKLPHPLMQTCLAYAARLLPGGPWHDP